MFLLMVNTKVKRQLALIWNVIPILMLNLLLVGTSRFAFVLKKSIEMSLGWEKGL